MLVRVVLLYMAIAACGVSAQAFDPFTVLATANAAVNLVDLAAGGHSKDALDMRELFSALGELNDELVPGGGTGADDPYRIARKIEAIERAALEAGYTKDEIDSILTGYRSGNQSLSQTIRLLSRSIRLGKRVAGLAGLAAVGGAGSAASSVTGVGAMQGQNQEKKILTDIYGQLLSSSLDQKKDEIEQQRAVQEQYKKLRNYVISVAPVGNIGMFPIDSSLIKKAIDVYNAYYVLLLVFVGTIFFGRVVYYQVSLAPPEKYTDLIRDVFACYFLILALPYAYTYMAEFSEALSVKLGQILHVTGNNLPPDVLPIDKTKWFWWFRWEVFPLLLYALTHVVFNLVVSILIALGPVVILIGTMMNFTVSLPAYFALLIFVWLWPTFWNVLGYFKNILWVEHDLGSTISAAILFLFQMLSPLAIYSMVKGTHGGKTVHGLAGGVKREVSSMIEKHVGNDRKDGKGGSNPTAQGTSPAMAGNNSDSRLLKSRQQSEASRLRQGILTGEAQYRV